MKHLLCLSLLFLTVSCQTIEDGFQAYQDDLAWKRFRELDTEWQRLYEAEPSCEVWEAKLQEFSEKYEKYGDMEEEVGILGVAKLYTDFKILFIQSRYEEAFAMGMEALPYVKDMRYGVNIMVELAITAKILNRYPEFQQKVDFWKTYSSETLLNMIRYTVSKHCDDSLQQMGILEWVDTLEPPSETTQE